MEVDDIPEQGDLPFREGIGDDVAGNRGHEDHLAGGDDAGDRLREDGVDEGLDGVRAQIAGRLDLGAVQFDHGRI